MNDAHLFDDPSSFPDTRPNTHTNTKNLLFVLFFKVWRRENFVALPDFHLFIFYFIFFSLKKYFSDDVTLIGQWRVSLQKISNLLSFSLHTHTHTREENKANDDSPFFPFFVCVCVCVLDTTLPNYFGISSDSVTTPLISNCATIARGKSRSKGTTFDVYICRHRSKKKVLLKVYDYYLSSFYLSEFRDCSGLPFTLSPSPPS